MQMDRPFSFTTEYERIYKKMTLPTQPERSGTEQPSEGLPIPTLETPSTAGPSSVDTDAIVKQVAEQLRREIRQAQSTKDKNAELVRRTPGISDLSELEAMGATIPENVKLEYRLRQIEGQQPAESSPVQKAPSPGNGAALTAADVSEVVKKFQLDANDADVINALRGTYRNRDHFEATLANMALARANRPQPSAADSASLNSGRAPSTDKAADIEKGYLEEVAKIPRGNTHQVSLVKSKWRKIAREAGLQLNV